MGTIAQSWIEQGMQRGIQQGVQSGRRKELLSGIELALELRYGNAGLQLLPEIRALEDVERLSAVREGIRSAQTPDELRAIFSECPRL